MTISSEFLDTADQFRQAMFDAGFRLVDPVAADGRFHRFHVEGDRRGSRNGWYVLGDSPPSGAFGSWKGGERAIWSPSGIADLDLTARLVRRRQFDEARRAREAVQNDQWERTAELAQKIWDQAVPATEHPYLSRKGIQPHGLRVGTFVRQLRPGPDGHPRRKEYTGVLLIPLRDALRKIWNLQGVFPEPVQWSPDGDYRDKAFLFGGRKAGLWFPVGKPNSETAPTVVLAEGFATAASVHEATELPVLVCFDAGNLQPVGREFRRVMPEGRAVFAADNDQNAAAERGCNTGVEKARAAAQAIGGIFVVPQFRDLSSKPTDFNDLLQLEGVEAVRAQFATAIATTATGGLEAALPAPATAPLPTDKPIQQPFRPQLGEDSLSEDAMADAFAARGAKALRYCHSSGHWRRWDGAIWRQDQVGSVKEEIRLLIRQLSAGEENPRRFRTNKFVGGVEALAQRDPRLGRSADHWDSDRMLLGVPGSVIDLRTGQVAPANPEYGITRSTSVAPAATPACPRWLAFLEEVTGGDSDTITFLRRYLGSCLTGQTRDHTLVFFYGDGGNGKSVLVDTIAEILGGYAQHAAMDMLMESRSQRHSTDFAMLKGARFLIANETEQGKAWAESRIKLLTGGDPITARFMRCDNFTFQPEFKLAVVGNHMPILQNVDGAMRRRFRVVPFDHQPAVVDKLLRERLAAEGPAILKWLIDACLEWQELGLGGSQIIDSATEAYLSEQDFRTQWVNEDCIVRKGDLSLRTPVADLYRSYRAKAKEAGEEPGSAKSVSMWLKKNGFQLTRTGSARLAIGIRLKCPG